ncbi:MAG: NUDIX domain-containing protein [Oscillospiraceae bacterium]|nr:NUDIX domain-containing protein [Oscillospiraceae bacterium]
MAWYDGAVVRFYDRVDDALLRFAVIIARTGGKWVFCKHRDRDTYELPGGHRETGESILEAAQRELYEETGALTYRMEPVGVYSISAPGNFNGEESFGMLCYAEIESFEQELHSEIESILITDRLPDNWSYPPIHPKLIEEARRRRFIE